MHDDFLSARSPPHTSGARLIFFTTAPQIAWAHHCFTNTSASSLCADLNFCLTEWENRMQQKIRSSLSCNFVLLQSIMREWIRVADFTLLIEDALQHWGKLCNTTKPNDMWEQKPDGIPWEFSNIVEFSTEVSCCSFVESLLWLTGGSS